MLPNFGSVSPRNPLGVSETPHDSSRTPLLSPSQVNYILESRASTARADYLAQKQRKLSRRTSFSFQKEKKQGPQ